MRILHLITTLDVGGAEMHLLSQVRGQVARGHAVRVAWLKGDGTLADDFRSAGAEGLVPAGTSPLTPFRLWPHLRWADVVHTHLLKADAVGAVLATLAGRRAVLISSKHNDEQVLRRAPVAFVHGLLARLPRRTIVLSDHVGAFFVEHGGVPPERMVRIHYGLDPEPFERAADQGADERAALRAELDLAPDAIVLICVARFAPQKAHDVLLRAFRAAHEAEPRLRMLLVGDDPFGPGRERAEALATELGLAETVRFLGVRRDVPRLLALSDGFVMSSLWEGFGLVFLEAMSAGLPVVASGVSGVPEVVADGVTGLLVPPRDVDALGAALGRVAADGALRERLGAAGRARVRERFGEGRMVDQTLEAYGPGGG